MHKVYHLNWLSGRCLHRLSLQFSICPTITLHPLNTDAWFPLLEPLTSAIPLSVFIYLSILLGILYKCRHSCICPFTIGLQNMVEPFHPCCTMCHNLRLKALQLLCHMCYFIHSTDGHVSSIHLLMAAVMIPWGTDVQIPMWVSAFNYFYMPEIELLGRTRIFHSIFEALPYCFP